MSFDASQAFTDTQSRVGLFYTHHIPKPRESCPLPRLRSVPYGCLTEVTRNV